MKLEDLKKEFRVVTLDGKYYVYNKEFGSSDYSNYKYLCNLDKSGNKFKIVGTDQYYSNVEDLKTAIQNYVDSLPFNCEFYNPQYREGYFESAVVNDYLRKQGFKSDGNHWGGIEGFCLELKNIYGGKSNKIQITISGLDYINEISETVDISLWTSSYSWISQTVKRDAVEIIKAINSIVKPLLLTDGINNVNESDKYNVEKFTASINEFDLGSLTKYSKEYKHELKEKLQQILETLD